MSCVRFRPDQLRSDCHDVARRSRGTLQSLSADIAIEQAALQAGWQGDTGLSYQAWQA
ncbi:MAG TPA: WXG100 family type VII secretion target, partial [Mycobacterium sp.]